MKNQKPDQESTLIIGDRFARVHAPNSVLLLN